MPTMDITATGVWVKPSGYACGIMQAGKETFSLDVKGMTPENLREAMRQWAETLDPLDAGMPWEDAHDALAVAGFVFSVRPARGSSWPRGFKIAFERGSFTVKATVYS